MFSEKYEKIFQELMDSAGMRERETAMVCLFAEIRDSLNRLVELAESDYADDEERLPRSLGERR